MEGSAARKSGGSAAALQGINLPFLVDSWQLLSHCFTRKSSKKLTTKRDFHASLWTKQIEGCGALPPLPEAARETRGSAFHARACAEN